MSPPLFHSEPTVGWNGIRIQAPAQWETIVADNHHLIFEEDFDPVFQIRWKNIGRLHPAKWKEKCDQWWQQLGVISKAIPLPQELTHLTDKFTHTRYYRGKQPMESGGLCYCSHCQTLFFFQQLDGKSSMWKKTAEVLSTLTCHGVPNTLWQIQDFSLTTPITYTLTDYTFRAGLSRLSFKNENCNVQICRLAQASHRLSSQSLKNILFTLADTRELELEFNQEQQACTGIRSPSITRQILLRMKKEKPFIESKIWIAPKHDRILACVASSTRPIPSDEVHSCYETLKIV